MNDVAGGKAKSFFPCWGRFLPSLGLYGGYRQSTQAPDLLQPSCLHAAVAECVQFQKVGHQTVAALGNTHNNRLPVPISIEQETVALIISRGLTGLIQHLAGL